LELSLSPRAKTLAVAALTGCLLSASLAFCSTALAAHRPSTATIDLGSNQVMRLSAGKRDVVSKSVRTGPAILGCTQVQRTYRVGTRKKPAGTVIITVRTLPSGSRIVFAELTAPKSAVPVSLELSNGTTTATMQELGLRPDLLYSNKTGVDKTSGPVGWVSFIRDDAAVSSAFVSRAYEYRNLTKSYSKSKKSTVRQLVRETRAVSLGKRSSGEAKLTLGLSAKKSTIQRYVLLTNRAIVDTASPEHSIGRVTAFEWRWMDPLGTYGKAEYSIEPVTKSGYLRHLVLSRATATLAAYRATGSPIYEDLLINNLYTLSLTRSADGLWKTGLTSTWIKGQSGVTAPFIDTRNNEVLGTRCRSIAEALAERGVDSAAPVRSWVFPLADYLIGRSRAGAVTRTTNGAYFADYYDSRGNVKTHTSLNHALGEMNHFLTLYQENSDPEYLATALQIKRAVCDDGGLWIRPNGDLWYQRNMNGQFVGTDYPTVTYDDLVHSQELFNTVLGGPDPQFAVLIASKAQYLGIMPAGLSIPSRETGSGTPAPTDAAEELHFP
jgi:hypothetical protein